MINSTRINCQPLPRKPYKISPKTPNKLFKEKHVFTSYNNEWIIYIYNGHALKCEDIIAEILSPTSHNAQMPSPTPSGLSGPRYCRRSARDEGKGDACIHPWQVMGNCGFSGYLPTFRCGKATMNIS